MDLSLPSLEQQTKKGSSLSQASHHAVQGGMWDESKTEGGIRNYRTFSGRMWDKRIPAGTGFAHFDLI